MLEQDVLNFSEGLRVIGLKPAKKVAFFADNSCRWLVADQGHFDFGTESYAIESILNLMKDRYKSYHHELRQRFRRLSTTDSAIADPPENMEQDV